MNLINVKNKKDLVRQYMMQVKGAENTNYDDLYDLAVKYFDDWKKEKRENVTRWLKQYVYQISLEKLAYEEAILQGVPQKERTPFNITDVKNKKDLVRQYILYVNGSDKVDYLELYDMAIANFEDWKNEKREKVMNWLKQYVYQIGLENFKDADASDPKIDDEISESIETSVSLERDLHNYLANRLTEIEPGLTLVDGGIEYQTEAGRIDILAKTAQGQLVVIELKAGKAKDGAIGQLLGYIGCLASQKDLKNIRGILVASSFEDRVVFASKGLPQIKLLKYELRFKLDAII